MRRARWAAAALALVVATLSPAAAGAEAPQVGTREPGEPLVLAHYYIWFNATSWARAKTDFPLLGRYSSDEASVMRRHIELAQHAGIDGFIVSWKRTPRLDQRLATLIDIAEGEDFGLAITYQGLDFARDPLPVEQVAADLDHFVEQFASSPAFTLFDKPLVVWTGTWLLSVDDIRSVTQSRRDDLRILATEKDVDGVKRVADVVDGDLYYWSSVDPETYPDHEAKLRAMADEVRATDGIWIAPAAPGFDARLVGGTDVVERRGGETLRAEWAGALASDPDAIGVISWNEFSENTHIEPSEQHGDLYLDVVAELAGVPPPVGQDIDSSQPDGPPSSVASRLLLVAGFLGLLVVGVSALSRRNVARRGAT